MNILFITPPPYLPNRLHRNRSFDLIRILAKKHQVHLFSVITEGKTYPEFKEIKNACKSVKTVKISKLRAFLNCVLFPHLPLEVAYCYAEEAKKAIVKIVKAKKIDFVYIKRLRSLVFVPDVDVPTVVDTTDAMSLFYRRLAENSYFPKSFFYKLESVKYQFFEIKVARRFKNWIVSSPVDGKYLQNLKLGVDIFVVPNAVDIGYFKPSTVNRGPNTLLLSGLMDKPVNVDAAVYFVKKVFPRVKRRIPDARLYIAGPKPNRKVRDLSDRDVVVKGYVKGLKEEISKSQIVVVPIRIVTGVRNKILQAWSMGKPVVSTTTGAQGLGVVDGENILIADTPKKFAAKVISLFEDRRLYNKLARNARKKAEEEYSFRSISQKLENVLKDVKKTEKLAGK